MTPRPDDHAQPPPDVHPDHEAARMPSAGNASTAPSPGAPQWTTAQPSSEAGLPPQALAPAAATAPAVTPPRWSGRKTAVAAALAGGGGGSTDPDDANGIRPTS